MGEPILPQQPTDDRVEIDSVEWLFEPAWRGRRLVAVLRQEAVILTGASGERVDDLSEVATHLARAIRSSSATLDGVWTTHPFVDADGEGHERDAFVAIDLLELDNERIFDVPFQERRRLLESILEEDLHVRVGPIVKQPIGGWLAGWRRAGFTHYLAHHQNARYRPGERSDDWLRVPIEAPSPPGLVRRVIGGGAGRRTRHIRD